LRLYLREIINAVPTLKLSHMLEAPIADELLKQHITDAFTVIINLD
jgi:hypothetical protein